MPFIEVSIGVIAHIWVFKDVFPCKYISDECVKHGQALHRQTRPIRVRRRQTSSVRDLDRLAVRDGDMWQSLRVDRPAGQSATRLQMGALVTAARKPVNT